jgi:hypothetical protein
MSSVVSAVTSAATAFSAAVPGWGTVASLALTGYSMMKERKGAKKAASAERDRAAVQAKQQEDQQKYSQVQAQRARVAQQRKARIAHGAILAQGGSSGLGMTGSSSLTGAIGSVSSQMGLNVGNINVGQGFAEGQTQQNIQQGNLQSQTSLAQAEQSGWSQMGAAFSNLSTNFGNPFDTGVKENKATQNYPNY